MKNDDKKYMPKAQKGMLSFAVTSTSQGQQVIYSINESIGEIKSFAEGSDDRNFYKHLAFKEGKDQVVICISHANEGCYLRILRYIPGRSGDNQEAWIYIPANLVVPADMLNQAITVVRNAILDTKLTEHTSGLEDVFKREYTIRDVHPMVKKSSQGKIAYRIIPKEGLQSLFGDKLFESYYYDFEKTLFVDNENLSVLDTYEDISSNGFTKWVAITHSSSDSKVTIKVDGVDLADGMMIDSQKAYTIEYQKADYLETITKRNKKFVIDTQLPDCKLDFLYELKATDFRVYDEETGEDLSEKANIKIGNYPLGESALFSESELREGKLKIAIKCFGYEDKSGTLKTDVPVSQPLVIKLKHKTSIYKFTINSKYLKGSKSDAEFELELKEKPSCSPLKSYEMSERANNSFHLRPLPVIFPNWKFLLKMFVGALIFTAIGLGLGYYLLGMSQSSSADSSEESTEVVTDSLNQQANTDSVETSEEAKKEQESSSEQAEESQDKDSHNSQDEKDNH